MFSENAYKSVFRALESCKESVHQYSKINWECFSRGNDSTYENSEATPRHELSKIIRFGIQRAVNIAEWKIGTFR